jgi:hypothetical protein
VASQGKRRRLVYGLLALLASTFCCTLVAAEDLIRFPYNVPGDSKPVVLHADEMATWVERGERIVLLRGKVLVEHGVVQARMQQAAAWIDQERYRRTGILRVEIYAEGEIRIQNGPEILTGARAFLDLSTRGEVKLRAQSSKVTQHPQPDDPFYQRALEVRAGQVRQNSDGPVKQASLSNDPVQQASFQVSLTPPPAQPAQPEPPAPQGAEAPSIPGPAPPGAGSSAPDGLASPFGPSSSAAASDRDPTPSPTSPVQNTRPPPGPAPPPLPGGTGPRGPLQGPARQFSILPRTSAGFEGPDISLQPNGEYVIVVTGGVILIVRATDGSPMLDVEADRLVLWTRNNPQQFFSNLRSQQGQTSREVEFFLTGNVEIRSQGGPPKRPENRVLRAEEVYYDVGRNVAVAMHADLELRRPDVLLPVHVRAEELQQLSPTLFKGVKSEVFASRLPSDPGLKVYVAEATVEEKEIPKKSIFGRQYINRQTGVPETENQRLFDGSSVFLELERVPVFYLPFLRGDVNDPLGPLESVTLGYNRVFGARVGATFNVFDLLGMDPLPETRWRFDADYLSRRGPAAGTTFEYTTHEFLGAPAGVTGLVKAFGIHDSGPDILGGDRGTNDNHPEWRGRLLWRQNVQGLPDGFSLQTQVSALSDKNFLEQYFDYEFANDINQETFAYLKQQQDNWAWTFLTQPNIRRWVNETEWLPRADGYLLGQSFFDLLTYNVHASAGYAHLLPTQVPPPPEDLTTRNVPTGRFDLMQELSAPFTLGPFRVVPYGVLDLTYYTEDLTREDRGRLYEGGGVRGSIPFTRLYPDVQSDLWNLNGINHKIVLSGNYYIAHSDVHFFRLPQLDRLNDDATDQALRDIKPLEPAINPAHGVALATSPLYDPQIYAIRRLIENRIDTLDTIEEIQADLRQRWQTKRGYPGQQHIVDWITLDLSGSFFPHPQRDNFDSSVAFLEYDWIWNVGDRTALVSTGWIDPIDKGNVVGARVFTIGAYLNRPDRTNFYIGYREIDPVNSKAVISSVTYVFSPKYAMTLGANYDFASNIQTGSLVFTRMGTDLQVSLGLTYNSTLNTFGATFEILPVLFPQNRRIPGLGTGATPLFAKQ